jgi:hypothetical protein
VYINSVANSVVLQVHLRHEFYNMIFKTAHKLHIASGSAPPCKIVGADVTMCQLNYTAKSGLRRRQGPQQTQLFVQPWPVCSTLTRRVFFLSLLPSKIRVKTSNQPVCCATQISLSLYVLICLLHKSKEKTSEICGANHRFITIVIESVSTNHFIEYQR